MQIKINEIFETIQGEATFTGQPAVFIRLMGCPVGCPWCDTKHTWVIEDGKERLFADIFTKVDESDTYCSLSAHDIVQVVMRRFKAKHIVFTGGEPALYDLREVTRLLNQYNYTTQIETSATHEIRVSPKTFITVSPKVNMKGGYKVLGSELKKADEIKYPIGRERDVDVLSSLIIQHDLTCQIWTQPISQGKRATDICIKACTNFNWRLSIQTHKFLNLR